MTERLPVSPAPGPLEDYSRQFDALFSQRNQRESFRRYLEGLLLPQERNKTLTALANTEPVVGAQHPHAQSLQWFLSESTWDPVERSFRDGHTETWWVLEVQAGPYGPEKPQRVLIATTDPRTLPTLST